MSEIHIVGAGAVTPVGACAAVSAASVRAGLARTRLIDRDDGAACYVAIVSSVARDESRVARMRIMLQRALAECGDALPSELEVPVMLAAPSDVPPSELLALGPSGGTLRIKSVAVQFGANGLAAVQAAIETLQRGEAAVACVAGVDVRTDDESLNALDQRRVLLREDWSWGFIPGEGAGVVLLATARACEQLKLPSLARVSGFASAQETSEQRGLPCTGEALTRACHALFDPLPSDVRAGEVYCDQNGERRRADEWAYTSARIQARCRDAVDVRVPALQWGDVGNATGPLLVQLAAIDLVSEHARGTHALIWCAGSEGTRVALLLERSATPTSSVPLPIARSRGRQALRQDDAALDEILDEAAFLFEQREHLRERREQSPENALTKQERSEQRLERQLLALQLGGEYARERASASQDPSPGILYTALRCLLATPGRADVLEYLATRELADPTVFAAVRSALSHSASSGHTLLVDLLRKPDAPLQALGLWLCGDLSSALPGRWETFARRGPAELGASFPWALGRIGSAEHVHWLRPWLESEDDALRQAAAIAYLRLDRSLARRELWQRDDAALLAPLALAISDVNEETQLLAACERHGETPSSALALGLLGSSAAVARLLERLTAGNGVHAARALHFITASEPWEDTEIVAVTPDDELTVVEREARLAGDTEAGVIRERFRRFTTDVSRWREASEAHSRRFAREARARFGMPLSSASDATVLVSPHFAPSMQLLCAESLRIAFGHPAGLRSDPRIRDQRALAAPFIGTR